MSDDRPKRETMSVEEATVSNMWEIAAIEEWPQGYPPRPMYFPSGLSPHAPCHYSFHRAPGRRLIARRRHHGMQTLPELDGR